MTIINKDIRINSAGVMYRTCDGLTCYPDGTPDTGLYVSAYRAYKACTGNDVVVHVCGGYRIMDTRDYYVWCNQR